jgi:hypothetical protein
VRPIWRALIIATTLSCRSADVRSAVPVAGGGRDGTRPNEAATRVSEPAPPAPETVALEGQTFRLHADEGNCRLVVSGRGEEKSLRLDLIPPCHFLVWQHPPPRTAGGPSNGAPVGAVGDPVAWRYAGKQAVAVMAVIGDPMAEGLAKDPVWQQRIKAGFRCAGNVQGILVRKADAGTTTVTTTKKRGSAGALCVEVGMDEKDYWLLAHP